MNLDFKTHLSEKLSGLSPEQLDKLGITETELDYLLGVLRELQTDAPRQGYRVLDHDVNFAVKGPGVNYDVPKALSKAEAEQVARFFARAFNAGENQRSRDISRLLDYARNQIYLDP